MRSGVLLLLLCEYTHPKMKWLPRHSLSTEKNSKGEVQWWSRNKAETERPEEEELEAVLALQKGVLACRPLHTSHSPKWSDSLYSEGKEPPRSNPRSWTQEVKPTYTNSSHVCSINSPPDRWWINSMIQNSEYSIRKGQKGTLQPGKAGKTRYLPGVLIFFSKNSCLCSETLQAVKHKDTLLVLRYVNINHYERYLKHSVGLLRSPVVTTALKLVLRLTYFCLAMQWIAWG